MQLYRPALTPNHITINLSLTSHSLTPGEIIMANSDKKRQTFIIDLEKLNALNAEGCMSCGRKFNLGETVVKACAHLRYGLGLVFHVLPQDLLDRIPVERHFARQHLIRRNTQGVDV